MCEYNNVPKIRFKGFTDVWEQRKLLGFAEYIDGNYGESYPKDGEFVESGVPFFTSAVTGSQGIWNYKYVKYITKEKNDTLVKAQSKGGDLVLTNRGASMGVISQIPLHYKDVNIGPQLTRIRGKENILDNLFLLSNLRTKKSYEQLLASNAGSAMPFISLTNLSNLEINFPNYDEQVKIGKLFANLDNLITLHQRKCDNLINVKKSLLEKMFPKNSSNIPEIRFKGFTDVWEQRKLGELYNFRYGDGNHNPSNGGKYDVYGANGIIGGYDKFNSEDSIIIGHMGEYAGSVLWAKGKHFVTYNGTITRPKKNNIDDKFGYYMLYRKELNKICGGSGLPFLSYQELNKVEVNYSKDKDEQIKISKLLTDLDNLITLHQRKLEKLKNIKKSMLEKMFV